MRGKRYMVQLEPVAYYALKAHRDRIQKLEGKQISLSDAVGTALTELTMTENPKADPLPPATEVRSRRMLVNAIGQLLMQVRPDLAATFKGVSFNEVWGVVVLDFADTNAIRLLMRDPVDMVKN